MPTLREVFTPLIAYVLFLQSTPDELRRSFSEIRGAIERLFEEQRTAIKRHDIAPQDYESASFAVTAWLDETIMRCAHDSNPELFAEWRRSPLQAELFSTANAGEEFFDRLERLTPAQKQIIEVYHLALCLGFRGRYYDESQDARLIELRHQYAAHLPAPPIELLDFEKRREHVTPEPYTISPPAPKPPARRLSPVWLAPPVAAAAAILLYLLWPSGLNAKAIQDATSRFDCAHIIVAGIDHGIVKLAGHVESDEERAQIRQAVEAVHGVKGVTDDFNLIPRPFCEVIDVLGPVKQLSDTNGFNILINPSKGCNATYYRGDNLIADVTANKPLRYVYVDYYVADRHMVSHLFPNPQQPNNSLQDSSEFTVGGQDSKAQWQIQPPFGREMVTVISSPKPLFSPPRLMPETAESYLASLKEVFKSDAPNSGLAANYCFTNSADR